MSNLFSFDLCSEVNTQELINAIQQTNKEQKQRFDLKNTNSSVDYSKEDLAVTLISQDEYTLKSLSDILTTKLIKRGISPKALNAGAVENAQGQRVRMVYTLQNGIPTDKAKGIVKDIKTTKLKVQSQIMDQKVRVTGKKKDDLQSIMTMIKDKDYGIHIEFSNYR